MGRQSIVLIVGILLVIIAIAILGASYYQGIENTEIIKIGPNSTAHYNFTVEDGKYVALLTSDSPFSYRIYDIYGSVVEEGNNVSSAEIELGEGKYRVSIENEGNKEISVAITIAREDVLRNITLLTYISGGICSVGMIVIVVGIVLILWYRKKEEKIYSRY